MTTSEFATKFTGLALILVTLFRLKFKDTLVTGRKVVLAEPAGPSSAGGQMAVQHITLQQGGSPTITVGWVNCATNACELRSWAYIEQVHNRRYPDRRFPVRRYEYIDFLELMKGFMAERNMTVAMKEPAKGEPVAAPTRLTTSHEVVAVGVRRHWLWAVAALLALAVAVAAYWFYLHSWVAK
jgi:hypothetical protein